MALTLSMAVARGDSPGPPLEEHYDNFAGASLGRLPEHYRVGSSSSGLSAPFTVVATSGRNVVTQESRKLYDVLYYVTPEPMRSISESYSFTYSGPASVVEPFLVSATPGAGSSVQGFTTNLTGSGPNNDNAGDESFVYVDPAISKRQLAIRGRLRTEPYFYHNGHSYRVDVIADSKTGVLSTRVYDVALGPQTFDQSIKAVPADFRAYPGIVNSFGGPIAVNDFGFGPAGRLPILPHAARRASDYMNFLGYNAAVSGPSSSILSRAFQTYFPHLLIKHVRVPADGGNFAPTINAVATFGINADIVTSSRTTIENLKRLIGSLLLAPDSIELWNEPNNVSMGPFFDPDYVEHLSTFTQELNQSFPKTTIWGPSVLPDSNGYPSEEAKLASRIGSLISGWNTHSYTRGTPENTGYGGFFSRACGWSQREDCGWYGSPNWNDNNSATINPNLPGISSEGAGSYGTYPEICGNAEVSLAAQQAYVQRGMLYNFKLGHARIYAYKFIDDGGCSDGFGTFGILSRIRNPDRSLLMITPKPAYTALAFLNNILSDTGGESSTFTPKPLSYSLRGASPDVETLLLAESDGSYRLVLWSDAKLWDFDANGPKHIGAEAPLVRDAVTVQFQDQSDVTTFTQTPLTGKWTANQRKESVNKIDVVISQFPLVISIGHKVNRLPVDVPTPGPTETPDPYHPRKSQAEGSPF